MSEDTGEQEALWDAHQAAEFMNVSRAWVYQRAEAGLLPHVRLGGLLRFEPAAVRKFVRHDRLSATHVIERASMKKAR